MIYPVDSAIQRLNNQGLVVGIIECSNKQSMYQRVDHTTVYSYLLGEVGALYIIFLDTVVLPVGGVRFLCLITITIEVF